MRDTEVIPELKGLDYHNLTRTFGGGMEVEFYQLEEREQAFYALSAVGKKPIRYFSQTDHMFGVRWSNHVPKEETPIEQVMRP